MFCQVLNGVLGDFSVKYTFSDNVLLHQRFGRDFIWNKQASYGLDGQETQLAKFKTCLLCCKKNSTPLRWRAAIKNFVSANKNTPLFLKRGSSFAQGCGGQGGNKNIPKPTFRLFLVKKSFSPPPDSRLPLSGKRVIFWVRWRRNRRERGVLQERRWSRRPADSFP